MAKKKINPRLQVILALMAGWLGLAAYSAPAAAADWSWTAFGADMFTPARQSATATLVKLDQGSGVLVAGGTDQNQMQFTNVAQVLSVGDTTWRPADSLNEARGEHTATLLPDGTVLVAGGKDFSGAQDYYGWFSRATAEIFHPGDYNWTWTMDGGGNQTKMATSRSGHTATLLTTGTNAGKVLVAGGAIFTPGNITDPYHPIYYKWETLKSCELYDPQAGTWAAADHPLKYPVMSHTATWVKKNLPDGTSKDLLLVVGGFTGINEYPKQLTPTNSCLLYDPGTGTGTGNWTYAASIPGARGFHTATLLPNGKVLVAGGQNDYVASQQTKVYKSYGIYDPDKNQWETKTEDQHLKYRRSGHTATLLTAGPDAGKVLLAGGAIDEDGKPTDWCELYDPATDSFTTSVSLRLNYDRANHTATLMDDSDHRVLLAGGKPNACEIYGPPPSALRGASRPPVKIRQPRK